MKEKLNIGIIGNGKSANRYHLPFILNRPEKFEVKTIWEHSDRRNWKEIEGVKYTRDLDEILQDPQIDLVIITTPDPTHYDLAKKALQAGKHVVLEKSFTKTADQAKELFDLAKEKNLILQAYQNRRFDSDFLTLKKLIEQGELGKPHEVELAFDSFQLGAGDDFSRVTPHTSMLYGLGSHLVDEAVALFGKPDKVVYDARMIDRKGRDRFDVDLFYDGLKVSLKGSLDRIHPRPVAVLTGERGMYVKKNRDKQEDDLRKFYLPDHGDFGLESPEDYGIKTWIDQNGNYQEQKEKSVRGDYSSYYDALYDSIVNGTPVLVTPEQTITVMEILEGAFK